MAEPGTSAVAERLFRAFKAHLVHGRVFRTIDAVREALRAFAARTNAAWPIGKNGCLGPRGAGHRLRGRSGAGDLGAAGPRPRPDRCDCHRCARHP
jgi:hypothetical protein